jgi:tetratricopeptide (TPR) repeat protein
MRIQHFVQWLVANWVLVSFLFVLVIALYVKFRFGTDYFFQSYRDAKTTKELSGFHQQIGDRMMAFQGWKAAEEAYRAALQVDPTNTAATFGIVKAQVFDPLPGQAFIDPEIVDVRLDYLLSRFPDDYQVHFLKALRCCQRGEVEDAQTWLRECVAKQPGFVGPYLLQGDIAFNRSDIEAAAAAYSRAVALDPNSPVAKNNLAACRVLLSDFQAAVELFQASHRISFISPNPVTMLSLGEAYWYTGQFDLALRMHQEALELVQKHYDPQQSRYVCDSWTVGFLPLQVGDLETIKTNMPFSTQIQKEALLYLELCIDQALLGDPEAAAAAFDAALKLERGPAFRRTFQNRMQSAENLVKLTDTAKAWLVDHRKLLA